MDTFLQQLVNGLTAGSLNAVVALGYTMVYGIIQLINFAHGEVVMIGAMVAFTVINLLAPSGLPPVAVVLVGTAAKTGRGIRICGDPTGVRVVPLILRAGPEVHVLAGGDLVRANRRSLPAGETG